MFGSTFPTIKCKLLTSKKLPSKFTGKPNIEHWILKAPKVIGDLNCASTVNVLLRFNSVF